MQNGQTKKANAFGGQIVTKIPLAKNLEPFRNLQIFITLLNEKKYLCFIEMKISLFAIHSSLVYLSVTRIVIIVYISVLQAKWKVAK